MAAVGVLPGGFVRDHVEPFPPGGWRQYFVDSDEQWSVAVIQARDAGPPAPYERKVEEAVVHDIAADIYSDPSGSNRTVQWTENGWYIQVHGSMTYGPPFVFDEALLRIAEGVSVPDTDR